jgi:plastocyanin domain-containing protein
MGPAEILVTLGGLVTIGAIARFFWGPRGDGVRAALTSSGHQELMVLVKGGYTPDTIDVQAGIPVRLNFRRDESAACTETVVFPEFGRSVALPEGETVPVEFTPERAGEYAFHCQMGMVRGRLLVREAS